MINEKTRLIASDFDGTLCRVGVISERDRAAIARWRREGNLFGIVTGRDPYGAQIAAAEHPEVDLDFVICCSGALVLDRNGRVLYESIADLSRLTELVRYIAGTDPLWLSRCLGGVMLGVPLGLNSERDFGERDESGRLFVPLEDFCVDIDGTGGFHLLNTAYDDPIDAAYHTEYINREFGDYVTVHRNTQCLDIAPSGIGKTEGIIALAAHLGITRERIVTVGDSYNDLGMLDAFGGYAVATAEEEITLAAPAVCADIAQIIEKYVG